MLRSSVASSIDNLAHHSLDGLEKFSNPWEGSARDPGQIAVSFYSGIYSYAGWNYLNFMTEELKDPYK